MLPASCLGVNSPRFIDLSWPKTRLAEHKSAGKDHAQGIEYIRGLVDSGRGKEAPHYFTRLLATAQAYQSRIRRRYVNATEELNNLFKP